MAPLPEHVKEALVYGAVSAPLLPTLADAPRLLEAGYQELENGYGIQDDGSMLVAVRTDMPGVSPAMVDWWFGWHSDETQRYKLWHPRAHVHAEWASPGPAPDTEGRARYVGHTSLVDEYVGSEMSRLAIQFCAPSKLGFDEALLDPEQATIVCARVGYSDKPIDAGYLVHHVRRVQGGAEMRSRFWLEGSYLAVRGGSPAGELVDQGLRKVAKASPETCRNLLVHCSQEMCHLASFLPSIHAALHG
jgi:hypothetical protein